MTDRRLAGLAIALAALFVLTGTGMSAGADKKAPEFTLPNLDGDDVTLSELLEDGPVIVDFWATWCKPCIKAFPDLQEIFDNYKNCGLKVVAISIDGPKSMSRVGSLIKSKGNTFEVLLDPSQKIARQFHVTSVPRTVLVRTDGTIAYAVTGYRPQNHEELGAAVARLLPEGCPEDEETEKSEEKTGE
ncbi:MAG: TlpA disulfide reductase family protein [Candidatus Eisenbacteria bacterium]